MERGQIALDDEVERVLPELAHPEVISPTVSSDEESRTFVLRPAKKKITLRQLITHSSGIPYDMFDPIMLAWRASREEPPMGLSGHVIKAYSTPLLFEPGEGWAYGGGVDWAGVMVSRLNGGVTLEQYMQKNICEPLGMDSTTYRLAEHPKIKARLAEMTIRQANGKLQPGNRPYPDPAAEDVGGAGLYTSVSDFVKLLSDILKDDPVILKRQTVDLMFTPQFAEGSAAMAGLRYNSQIIGAMTGSGDISSSMNFGLGGVLSLQDCGMMRKGTLAWGGMPNMIWFLNREAGAAGVYASQVLPPGDAASSKLANQFIDSVYTSAG